MEVVNKVRLEVKIFALRHGIMMPCDKAKRKKLADLIRSARKDSSLPGAASLR